MTQAKKPRGVAQEVEYFSGKHKTLSLNPSTGKTEEEKKTIGQLS
jgi:hypothetical protein